MDTRVDNKLHTISYIRIRKSFRMGISVPISTEYYKLLKQISDDLGLGLKRTVEFLVAYYNEKEVTSKTSVEKITQVKQDQIGIAHKAPQTRIQEKIQPQISSTVYNPSTHHDVENIPYAKIVPATTEVKTQKTITTNPSQYQGSRSSSSQRLGPESLTTEKQSSNAAAKFLEQAYRSAHNCCYSCGFPKKPNAKFCSNCGTLLQAKS